MGNEKEDAALRIAANNGDNAEVVEIICRGKANINSLNKVRHAFVSSYYVLN